MNEVAKRALEQARTTAEGQLGWEYKRLEAAEAELAAAKRRVEEAKARVEALAAAVDMVTTGLIKHQEVRD